ncbi:MAG: class I SAM-dependent methyltransferase [Pseudonocardia sp.]
MLDVGCGSARWTVALARHGGEPVGIDSSPRQLKHARRVVREAGLDIALVFGDAERLSFADASSDIVAYDWARCRSPTRTVRCPRRRACCARRTTRVQHVQPDGLALLGADSRHLRAGHIAAPLVLRHGLLGDTERGGALPASVRGVDPALPRRRNGRRGSRRAARTRRPDPGLPR